MTTRGLLRAAARLGHPTHRLLLLSGVSCILSLGLVGCGDDPFTVHWEAAPDTALLYALSRPEPNLPSAFDFSRRARVQVETVGATGTWDVALDFDGTQLVFLPPGAVGINSRARVAALPGLTFDEVLEAPADTSAYVRQAPVPVTDGTVYVVQTEAVNVSYGATCVYFAKVEPLVIDVEHQILTFVYDTNPVCNDTRLVPPDNG